MRQATAAVRRLTAVTDRLVGNAVAPLVKVASTLSPKSFARVGVSRPSTLLRSPMRTPPHERDAGEPGKVACAVRSGPVETGKTQAGSAANVRVHLCAARNAIHQSHGERGAVALDGQHDENYPVAKLRVAVNPGASVTVTVDIVAVKPGKKTLDAIITPMVHASAVDRPVLDCATVPAG